LAISLHKNSKKKKRDVIAIQNKINQEKKAGRIKGERNKHMEAGAEESRGCQAPIIFYNLVRPLNHVDRAIDRSMERIKYPMFQGGFLATSLAPTPVCKMPSLTLTTAVDR
jgi:hypothetical protein